MQKDRVAWLFLLLQPFPDLFPPFSRLRIKKAIKRDKCRKRWKKPCHKRTQNELHLFLMREEGNVHHLHGASVMHACGYYYSSRTWYSVSMSPLDSSEGSQSMSEGLVQITGWI